MTTGALLSAQPARRGPRRLRGTFGVARALPGPGARPPARADRRDGAADLPGDGALESVGPRSCLLLTGAPSLDGLAVWMSTLGVEFEIQDLQKPARTSARWANGRCAPPGCRFGPADVDRRPGMRCIRDPCSSRHEQKRRLRQLGPSLARAAQRAPHRRRLHVHASGRGEALRVPDRHPSRRQDRRPGVAAGDRGMLELVGGILLLIPASSPARSPSCCRARWPSPISSSTFRRVSGRSPTGASPRPSTASSGSTSRRPAPGHGASTPDADGERRRQVAVGRPSSIPVPSSRSGGPGVGDALGIDPGALGVERGVARRVRARSALVRVAGEHEGDVARRARGAAPRPTGRAAAARRSPRARCRSPRRRRRSRRGRDRWADARRSCAPRGGRSCAPPGPAWRSRCAWSAPRDRDRSGRAPRPGTSRSRLRNSRS